MIDFRYHLVSIVAVFLALAIGIVLGSSALKGPVIKTVDQVADELRATNGDLRDQVVSLRQQVEADQKLVQRIGPGAVDGQLEGERVLVVDTPGSSAQLRDKLVSTLKQAGATLTGRVAVRQKYLEKGQSGVIGELASQLKPSGATLPDGSPYERAAALVAGAVMTADGSASGASSEQAEPKSVLSGFETAGYLAPSGDPGGNATLAVVIAPKAPYDSGGAAADNRVLVDLAAALDKHGSGTLVAGTTAASQPGGLVSALRGSGQAAKTVSSIDFAGTATGRIGAVFALKREGEGKGGGHFGIGGRAETYLPTVPSSSPTSSSESTERSESSEQAKQ